MSRAGRAYRAGTIKRERRTSARIEQLDAQILEVLETDHPQSVRHVFYRMTNPLTSEAQGGIAERVPQRARRLPMDERMPDRLVVTPEADPQKAGRFTARLESTGALIVTGSRQPLVDGARELIARRFDPATPLTMRHEGAAHDSFQSAPIGEWTKWTYQEGEKRSLTRARWMSFADMRGGQKSGCEASTGVEGYPPEIRLYDRTVVRRDDVALESTEATRS